MPVNIRGRNFLKLLDYTPAEIRYLLDLAKNFKGGYFRMLSAGPAVSDGEGSRGALPEGSMPAKEVHTPPSGGDWKDMGFPEHHPGLSGGKRGGLEGPAAPRQDTEQELRRPADAGRREGSPPGLSGSGGERRTVAGPYPAAYGTDPSNQSAVCQQGISSVGGRQIRRTSCGRVSSRGNFVFALILRSVRTKPNLFPRIGRSGYFRMLSAGPAVYLLDLAKNFKDMKRAGVPHRYLEGKNIVLLFEKTSTRTRCSFEVAKNPWMIRGHLLWPRIITGEFCFCAYPAVRPD